MSLREGHFGNIKIPLENFSYYCSKGPNPLRSGPGPPGQQCGLWVSITVASVLAAPSCRRCTNGVHQE
ncbi:hypothetical protein EYF80_010885 [Liparis tanakae]|uniref:Uncharacterized protein n=1 Tax=Liparis tanakae TaxID=230148 RepID=A0A4Z2ILQ3_9TELE|nr:hypothetical protein EYF80_010885 [Liparis tanakae]